MSPYITRTCNARYSNDINIVPIITIIPIIILIQIMITIMTIKMTIKR